MESGFTRRSGGIECAESLAEPASAPQCPAKAESSRERKRLRRVISWHWMLCCGVMALPGNLVTGHKRFKLDVPK